MVAHSELASDDGELITPSGGDLKCSGDWTLSNTRDLRRLFLEVSADLKREAIFDFSALKRMDSAGALVLEEMLQYCSHHQLTVKIRHLNDNFRRLVELIQSESAEVHRAFTETTEPNWFFRVGQFTIEKIENFLAFLAFVGEFTLSLLTVIRHPRLLKWTTLLSIIDDVGARALSIVALMAFLIGVVLAYQLGSQLKSYGANIFVVQITGIAILREFGPLITAIIIAGRTSTSFSALIGTMKVNEELDALRVMGKTPIVTLVLPRVIGLFIALPLLVVWADMFSVLGSMVVAKSSLNIGYSVFLQKFQMDIGVKQYVLGMLKVPIFAIVIATVGCFQGLKAELSADSVGRQTTQAAVQSIFLIIIVDAVYSVLVSWLGV